MRKNGIDFKGEPEKRHSHGMKMQTSVLLTPDEANKLVELSKLQNKSRSLLIGELIRNAHEEFFTKEHNTDEEE